MINSWGWFRWPESVECIAGSLLLVSVCYGFCCWTHVLSCILPCPKRNSLLFWLYSFDVPFQIWFSSLFLRIHCGLFVFVFSVSILLQVVGIACRGLFFLYLVKQVVLEFRELIFDHERSLHVGGYFRESSLRLVVTLLWPWALPYVLSLNMMFICKAWDLNFGCSCKFWWFGVFQFEFHHGSFWSVGWFQELLVWFAFIDLGSSNLGWALILLGFVMVLWYLLYLCPLGMLNTLLLHDKKTKKNGFRLLPQKIMKLH